MAKELSDRVEPVDQENTTKVIVVGSQSNETVDNYNGEESVDRPTSSSQLEQRQESEADTDDENSKTKLVKQRARRDSGWYPPNWNMLLNQNEPRPPALAGITEVRTYCAVSIEHSCT